MITGIAVGCLAKVIYDMNESDKINERAQTKSLKAMNRLAEANLLAQQQIEAAKLSILRLANRKRGILTSSMKSFLDIYEKIKVINFTEGEGIKELSDFTIDIRQELNYQISVASVPMTEKEAMASLFSMALLGSGVSPLAQTAPCMATGVVAGPVGRIAAASMVVSASIKQDANKNLHMASAISKQANVISEQAKTISIAYDAVSQRADRITDVLTKLNVLFVKILQITKESIDKNGSDKTRYTLDERKKLAVCVNLAGAIKDILDTPLLNEKGDITLKSLEAIQTGEEYIGKINAVLMS